MSHSKLVFMQGPCVAEAIDAFQAAERDIHKPLRMPIVEVFRGSRGAPCISGKVEAGAMKVPAARHFAIVWSIPPSPGILPLLALALDVSTGKHSAPCISSKGKAGG